MAGFWLLTFGFWLFAGVAGSPNNIDASPQPPALEFRMAIFQGGSSSPQQTIVNIFLASTTAISSFQIELVV